MNGRAILGIISLLALAGCQFRARSPLGSELTSDDFQTLTTPTPPANTVRAQRSAATASALPEVFKTKLSVHTVADLPLHVVFEAIGEMLNIDIHLDDLCRDELLNLSASHQPLSTLLETVCSLAKLRYRFENGLLRIEPDAPFSRSYSLQFLNLVRSSENKISSGTDIFSHSPKVEEGGQVTCQGGDNGSNTSVSMNSSNDFWKELELNLQNLLTVNDEDEAEAKPHFALHRQAGMVSVWGTSEQHYRVQEYLDLLRKAVSSQILIEAKVIEVALNEQFRHGIDWAFLKEDNTVADGIYGGRNFSDVLLDTATGTVLKETVPSGFIQYTAKLFNGMGGIVTALQKFGATRTLSSPRLTVMNNQSAILKVAKNHVYFKLNYSRHISTHTNYNDFSVGSDIQTIPVGLVMSVQPAIDPSTHSVILFLRPTISRLVDEVKDPSVTIAAQQNVGKNATVTIPDSKVPVVEVKEIDSVLRLKDDEVGILGGLMETRSHHERYKNPILGDVPVVKEAFSSLKKEDDLIELVILIRVKILDTPSPSASDQRLAHFYIKDPRPFC